MMKYIKIAIIGLVLSAPAFGSEAITGLSDNQIPVSALERQRSELAIAREKIRAFEREAELRGQIEELKVRNAYLEGQLSVFRLDRRADEIGPPVNR
jgi:hypothetical protein